VTDQEYLVLYGIASDRIQCLMDMATITGQREGDLLKLPNRDPTVYTDEGIVFRPGKSKRRHPRHGKMIETGKTVIVEWSPELDAVVKRLRKPGILHTAGNISHWPAILHAQYPSDTSNLLI